MNFIFRVDASLTIGTGHLRRCLCLARLLKKYGSKISFICSASTVQLFPDLSQSFAIHILPDNLSENLDAEESLKYLNQITDSSLVLDHYKLGLNWELLVQKKVKQLIVIDDLLRQHNSDILIDQNFRLDYENLYSDSKISNIKLLSPRYCILDEKFAEVRKKLPEYLNRKQEIFACFGGSDTRPILKNFINIASKLSWQGSIVAGSSVNDPELELQTNSTNFKYYQTSNRIADMMSEAQLAVGAGGTMNWERLCLGLPCYVVTIADNQLKISQDLAKAGYIYFLGELKNLNILDLPSKINDSINNVDQRRHMSEISQKLVDAKGSKRITSLLISKYLELRSVLSDDCQNIFEWRNHELNRKYSLNHEPISWETHESWFKNILHNENQKILIVSHIKSDIGVIRFDFMENYSEISIYLIPGLHHQGYGLSMLFAAKSWLKNNYRVTKIQAKIFPDNHASLSIFKDAGYKLDKYENNYQIWYHDMTRD